VIRAGTGAIFEKTEENLKVLFLKVNKKPKKRICPCADRSDDKIQRPVIPGYHDSCNRHENTADTARFKSINFIFFNIFR
jgi:hypothetical protein